MSPVSRSRAMQTPAAQIPSGPKSAVQRPDRPRTLAAHCNALACERCAPQMRLCLHQPARRLPSNARLGIPPPVDRAKGPRRRVSPRTGSVRAVSGRGLRRAARWPGRSWVGHSPGLTWLGRSPGVGSGPATAGRQIGYVASIMRRRAELAGRLGDLYKMALSGRALHSPGTSHQVWEIMSEKRGW